MSTSELREQAVEDGLAVRCRECGSIKTRLQHTHFKYKCTGRFKSGKEYLQCYPDAEVVTPMLKRLTAGTKRGYVEKYGKSVGEQKWNEYKRKQAISNSFEYKSKKHGWDIRKYNQYNTSRSNTLENCIERYGEEEGRQRWSDYITRQSYTISKDYFVEKHGTEEGVSKFREFCKRRIESSSHPISKIEQEFGEWWSSIVGETPITQEYFFDSKNNKSYTCDFVFPQNKIVEFFGTVFHADPRKFAHDDVVPIVNKQASEIWEHDFNKARFLTEKNSYSLFIVWENDFRLKSKRNELQKYLLKWWFNGN